MQPEPTFEHWFFTLSSVGIGVFCFSLINLCFLGVLLLPLFGLGSSLSIAISTTFTAVILALFGNVLVCASSAEGINKLQTIRAVIYQIIELAILTGMLMGINVAFVMMFLSVVGVFLPPITGALLLQALITGVLAGLGTAAAFSICAIIVELISYKVLGRVPRTPEEENVLGMIAVTVTVAPITGILIAGAVVLIGGIGLPILAGIGITQQAVFVGLVATMVTGVGLGISAKKQINSHRRNLPHAHSTAPRCFGSFDESASTESPLTEPQRYLNTGKESVCTQNQSTL